VGMIMGGSRMAVEGIGDVELRVRKPQRDARPSYSVIRLKDVLYCPRATCNIISHRCSDLVDGYKFSYGESFTKDGIPVGLVDNPKLMKLRLSGQAPNVTSLDKNDDYMLSIIWPGEERRRWQREKTISEARAVNTSSYTEEEKAWLKQHWGGEFRFLA
jgi:hypothetical protein